MREVYLPRWIVVALDVAGDHNDLMYRCIAFPLVDDPLSSATSVSATRPLYLASESHRRFTD